MQFSFLNIKPYLIPGQIITLTVGYYEISCGKI